MSIIHDALKKVQNSLGKNSSPQPPAAGQAGTPAQPPPENKSDQPAMPTVEAPAFGSTLPWTEHPKAPWEVGQGPANPPAPSSQPQTQSPPLPQAPPQKAPRRTSLGTQLFLLGILVAVVVVFLKSPSSSFVKKFAAKIKRFQIEIPVNPKPAPVPLTVSPTPADTGLPGTSHPELTVEVSGIMVSGGQKVALINNKVYAEGEEINGMKIIHISFDRVKVIDQGVEKEFKVATKESFSGGKL